MTVSTMIPAVVSRPRQLRLLLENIIKLSVSLYGVLLAVYLILRLVLVDTVWWLALLHNFAPYYFLPLLLVVPILWVLRMRLLLIRLLPLLFIGLWLYGPRFVPKTAAIAGEPALKVVTFNIPLPISDLESIADWLRATDADLILLQELGPENSAQLFALLDDDYPQTIDLPGTTQSALSRLPILSSEQNDVGGWFADRLVVEIEGEPLAVYNVHLPVPYSSDDDVHVPGADDEHDLVKVLLSYDETWRNTVLRNLMTMIGDETLPYIVAGDFNTSDNALIYNDLAALMHDSFREVAAGLGTTWPADSYQWPPLVRLDYVWHSDDLRAVTADVGPHLGSDHLPLVVTLARQ